MVCMNHHRAVPLLCTCAQEDESALTRPATKVQVDLALSAYSNAAVHHTTRKKQLVKQEKTLTAHAEALRAAEKKAAATLTTLRNSAAVPQVCCTWCIMLMCHHADSSRCHQLHGALAFCGHTLDHRLLMRHIRYTGPLGFSALLCSALL
jgi:hypothetical protein